jgi:putative ABC transport system permease protein
MLPRLRSLIEGIFRRAPVEQHMDDELRFHIAAYAEDLERGGVPRLEAERRARAEFAGLEGLKEQCREARGLRIFDELAQDVRYAVRGFRKSPAFAAIAILTLALGTGANTALFSAVKSWVLEPVPFPQPDRLVSIWGRDAKSGQNRGASAADFYDWQAQANVFEQIVGWNDGYQWALTGDGDPEIVRGARVMQRFFPMFGTHPALGRDFTSEDDQPGAAPVAIIADGLWQSRFGGNPSVIGRTMEVDGRIVTIVGVMPRDFQFALVGRVLVWMPFALSASGRQERAETFLNVTARMKSDVSLAQASATMNTIVQRLARAYPATNKDRAVLVRPLAEEIGLDYARELLAVFGIVACVMLIACVNVANLMVTRASARQREFAVRLALGASRPRLARQVITENVLLFVGGAALGFPIALGGAHWLSNLLPLTVRGYIPDFGEARVDLGASVYMLAVAVFTGLVFGLAPALETARTDVNHRLKENARSSAGASGLRLKNLLVVFETALALTVLIAAGLLGNSLLRIFRADPGFDPSHLGLVRIAPSPAKYGDLRKAEAFYNEALARIRAIPGVTNCAATRVAPFGDYYVNMPFAIPGEAVQREPSLTAVSPVTRDYFATLGIPLLEGRTFDDRDREDSLPVVIIDQTMAGRYWPGVNPVGQHLLQGGRRKDLTIVGVVKDVKIAQLTEKPGPQMYLPLSQSRALNLRLVVRTVGDPANVGSAIRSAVWSIDRNQPVSEIETMDSRIREEHVAAIYLTQVVALFAGLALLLAAIGIYGVTCYAVAARKQEIGIRIALGATRSDVIAMVLRNSMLLAGIGLIIGAIGSVAVTQLLSSVLFDIRITDVATFAAVSALLACTALLASFIPARRAAACDPARTLHHD